MTTSSASLEKGTVLEVRCNKDNELVSIGILQEDTTEEATKIKIQQIFQSHTGCRYCRTTDELYLMTTKKVNGVPNVRYFSVDGNELSDNPAVIYHKNDTCKDFMRFIFGLIGLGIAILICVGIAKLLLAEAALAHKY